MTKKATGTTTPPENLCSNDLRQFFSTTLFVKNMNEREVQRLLAGPQRGKEDDEIEDFLERANFIEERIRAIKEGRLPLEELQRQEDEENRERLEQERLKKKHKLEYEKREKEKRIKEKREEKEHWWRGAELSFSHDSNEGEPSIQMEDDDESAREKMLRKYETDYSKWSERQWQEEDPASRAEREEKDREETRKENEAFEKRNAEFCESWKEDMKRRETMNEKKQASALEARMKGNVLFKKKKYDEALETYKESLKSKPYEAPTLLNMAQVYLRLDENADALEFATRALKVVSQTNLDFRAKILSRRAAAKEKLNDLKGAEDDLREAVTMKNEPAIATHLANVIRKRQDIQKEKNVQEKVKNPTKSKDEEAEQVLLLEKILKEDSSDSLKKMERMLAAVAEATDESNALATIEEAFSDVGGLYTDESLMKVDAALRSSAEARVLCRLKGGIKVFCELLGAKPLPETGAATQDADGAFDISESITPSFDSAAPEVTERRRGLLLAALGGAIAKEPKSKDLAVGFGAKNAAKESLLTDDAKVRLAAMEFIAELANTEDASDRAFRSVARDRDLLKAVVEATALKQKNTKEGIALAAVAARALGDLAAKHLVIRETLLPIADLAVASAAIGVREFGKYLLTSSKKSDDTSSSAREGLESAAAALAQLARTKEARPFFGVSVDESSAAKSTPCGILLSVARQAGLSSNGQSLALAALANACFECERARAAAEAAGGVAVAFELSAAASPRGDDQVRARAAQLLARLVHEEDTKEENSSSAAQTLRASKKALSLVVRAAARAHANTRATKENHWPQIERDALVRALATALSPKDPSSIEALEDDYAALVDLLPAPQADLGHFTAQSVALPPDPADRVPAALACNALKALIAALSVQGAPAFKARLLRNLRRNNDLLERLVAAFANFKELPLRRNLAVHMAKIIAIDPSAKDRLRDIRGMEMLTTIGHSLLPPDTQQTTTRTKNN